MKRYYLCIISGFINVTGNPNGDVKGNIFFEYFYFPGVMALLGGEGDHITRRRRCQESGVFIGMYDGI